MLFDTLFLDLDGPLFDIKNRHYQCYSDIINTFGGIAIDIDEYWSLKRKKGDLDVLLKKSHFHEGEDIFIKSFFENIEHQNYLRLDRLKPFVIQTLTDWKKIYVRTLFLTTMRQNRSFLESQLDNFNLRKYFDDVLLCDPSDKNSKCSSINSLTQGRTLLIGDTESDMDTARNLGIPSVAITNGIREKKYLNADYYYNEIRDIDLERIVVA